MSASPKPADLTNVSLSADFLKILIESTAYVLKVQATVEVQGAQTAIYDASTFKFPIAVAATIGIIGDFVKGGTTLAFPKDTFIAIANKMLGESYQDITSENQDLSGELLNIIFGSIKSKFTDTKKIPIQPAVPIVLRSQDLRFSFDTKEPTHIISFKTSLGSFYAAASISIL